MVGFGNNNAESLGFVTRGLFRKTAVSKTGCEDDSGSESSPVVGIGFRNV
jgi:hypothetical protein